MRLLFSLTCLMAAASASWAADPPPFESLIRIPATESNQISYSGDDADLHSVILRRLKGRNLVVVRQVVSTTPLTALGPFTTTFHDLGPGQYLVTVLDDLGNASNVPFRISDLSMSLRSSMKPSLGEGKDIRADGVSTAGMDYFNLYSLTQPDRVTVLAKRVVRNNPKVGGVTFPNLAAGFYAPTGSVLLEECPMAAFPSVRGFHEARSV